MEERRCVDCIISSSQTCNCRLGLCIYIRSIDQGRNGKWKIIISLGRIMLHNCVACTITKEKGANIPEKMVNDVLQINIFGLLSVAK